jgi:hypothetical protein
LSVTRGQGESGLGAQDNRARAYVLVALRPGKEKEFCDEILSKGLILDSEVERMDFVHGSFDFVLTLRGTIKSIDQRLMELRKSSFVRKTETLICFEMFTWEDLSSRLCEEARDL